MRFFRPKPRAGVLFVCMGNICRSPTAEGVFREQAKRAGIDKLLRIDSAGTHASLVNAPPDARSIAAAARRKYEIGKVRARKVTTKDFETHDFVLAMDRKILKSLEAIRPEGFGGQLALLLDFAPEAAYREVPDPYYGGPEGFELVLDLVETAVKGLLPTVRRKIGS
jgi:protein-tyrosine phosphatase